MPPSCVLAVRPRHLPQQFQTFRPTSRRRTRDLLNRYNWVGGEHAPQDRVNRVTYGYVRLPQTPTKKRTPSEFMDEGIYKIKDEEYVMIWSIVSLVAWLFAKCFQIGRMDSAITLFYFIIIGRLDVSTYLYFCTYTMLRD